MAAGYEAEVLKHGGSVRREGQGELLADFDGQERRSEGSLDNLERLRRLVGARGRATGLEVQDIGR